MKKVVFALMTLALSVPVYAQQPTQEPTVTELKAEIAQLKGQLWGAQQALLQCQLPQVRQDIQATQSAVQAEKAKKNETKPAPKK